MRELSSDELELVGDKISGGETSFGSNMTGTESSNSTHSQGWAIYGPGGILLNSGTHTWTTSGAPSSSTVAADSPAGGDGFDTCAVGGVPDQCIAPYMYPPEYFELDRCLSAGQVSSEPFATTGGAIFSANLIDPPHQSVANYVGPLGVHTYVDMFASGLADATSQYQNSVSQGYVHLNFISTIGGEDFDLQIPVTEFENDQIFLDIPAGVYDVTVSTSQPVGSQMCVSMTGSTTQA